MQGDQQKIVAELQGRADDSHLDQNGGSGGEEIVNLRAILQVLSTGLGDALDMDEEEEQEESYENSYFSGWCGWNEWWCYSQRITALKETALIRIMGSVLEMLRFEVLFFIFSFEIFN